jgi:hypothetical protein
MRPDSEPINSNNYTIRTVERVFSSFPQKKAKDKKKLTEEEKKKQEDEEAALKAIPKVESTF